MRELVAVLLVAAACAAPPKPVEPITSKAPPPTDVRPVTPTEPPKIAGHERVRFDPNSPAIAETEKGPLDKVIQALDADAALNFQISGHTDPTERNANDTGPGGLSAQRAASVKAYLMAAGIAERRLLVRAVGSTEPRDTNANERGRGANRRVEFEKVTIKIDPFGGRVVVTDTDVEILDPVTFLAGKDVLEKSSYPALDAIASTLHGNPSIQLVEVQSHTDERGDAGFNLKLSQARANVVVSYLVGKGIDPARLVAQGYGETQPLDARHDETAWAKNMRVAFLILKRAP